MVVPSASARGTSQDNLIHGHPFSAINHPVNRRRALSLELQNHRSAALWTRRHGLSVPLPSHSIRDVAGRLRSFCETVEVIHGLSHPFRVACQASDFWGKNEQRTEK
jgi:hypothetical protein